MAVPKMRPVPPDYNLPQQSKFLQRLYDLCRDGFGYEDIYVILKRERTPAPMDQIRRFVLRLPS